MAKGEGKNGMGKDGMVRNMLAYERRLTDGQVGEAKGLRTVRFGVQKGNGSQRVEC